MYQLQTTMNILAPNGKIIGEIYQEVDGYYVFAFVDYQGGYLDSEFFLFVAEKLKELNRDWAKKQDNRYRTMMDSSIQAEIENLKSHGNTVCASQTELDFGEVRTAEQRKIDAERTDQITKNFFNGRIV